MQIILASSSPRRKDILKNYYDNIIIKPPTIEEKVLPDDLPLQFCNRTSKEKAEAVAGQITEYNSFLVISCDTIVAIESRIIGKPVDLNDAIKIIQSLSGREHSVISSITLLMKKNQQIEQITESETSIVVFKSLSNTEIINYLNKINYTDKAGAYAIQEHGNLIIDTIHGSMTNIIGFPLRLFFKMLSEMNLLYKI